MRLSCCAYSYRDELNAGKMTLEEFVDIARGLEMDGVELTAYYFPRTDRDYLNRLKRYIHRSGLDISGTAVSTDFAQPAPEKRRAHVEMAKTWVNYSVVLGAPTMRVFAGSVREGCSEEETFRWVVECLQEVAAYGAEQGVLVALENHGGLTSTAEQTLRLLHAVDSEWMGLNLDFGNFQGDIWEQFTQCAPFAVATHAKVSYKTDNGKAPVDYQRVKQIMDTADYRGFIAIEYEEAEDPREGVPRFAQELVKIFRGG
jgi:sugar phosphate isomerase/epimerase